jgi:hypothetical protein
LAKDYRLILIEIGQMRMFYPIVDRDGLHC